MNESVLLSAAVIFQYFWILVIVFSGTTSKELAHGLQGQCSFIETVMPKANKIG